MKKTIKINLGGRVFQVDEDAYENLKAYLNAIRQKFKDVREGAEIMEDIEARISEILSSFLKEGMEIISQAELDEVIRIIGEPSELDEAVEDDEKDSEFGTQSDSEAGNSKKRLYRDKNDAILGGVCSGIGHYLKIDPLWIRILFVIFTLVYLSGLLIYLVLWVVLPQALTTTQRMQMKGEKISIRNIEKNIQEEYKEMKEKVENYSKSEAFKRDRPALENFFYGLGNVIVMLLRIILGIIGFALVISLMTALVSLIVVFFFRHSFFLGDVTGLNNFYLPDLMNVVMDTRLSFVFLILTFLCVSIPLLALIYLGVRMIFQFRAKDRALWLVFFLTWVLSISGIVGIGLIEGMNINPRRYAINSQHELDLKPSDTLFISLNNTFRESGAQSVIHRPNDNYYSIYYDSEADKVLCTAELELAEGDKSFPYLEIQKHALGRNKRLASRFSKNIVYHFENEGNHLKLDEYFTMTSGQKWRGQEVEVKLYIPEGLTLCFDESVEDIMENHMGWELHNWEMGGHYWRMENGELIRTDTQD